MFSQKKLIVWDWNGTLLNDVEICIDAMNSILTQRSMKKIDIIRYREIFDFPVINYYRKLGFNLESESFEELSVEFISNYTNLLKSAVLHEDVYDILQAVKERGKKQIILSAMQQSSLVESVRMLNINGYFNALIGLEDIYANGKTELAKKYFRQNHFMPQDILFVGDTIHDYEVANAVGADCVLMSGGHHSLKRLHTTGVHVLESHKDLLSLL